MINQELIGRLKEDIKKKIIKEIHEEVYEKVKKEAYEDIYNKLWEDDYDEIYESVEEKIHDDNHDKIYKKIESEIREEVRRSIYKEEIYSAKVKAREIFDSDMELFNKLLGKSIESEGDNVYFPELTDDIVKYLLNHEWGDIASPLEVLLLDRLRHDSSYMADLEKGLVEDFEKEIYVKIIKNDDKMMQNLKDEIEKDFIEKFMSSL